MNRSFTLPDLSRIISYLDGIGITDCYLSPILMAKEGSVHGYDVVNPAILNPELGGEEAFEEVARRLRERGMGMIVDVVPNHMCISDPKNVWWFDVLENGPSSPFAPFFDIEWRPLRENLTNKALLPVLDRQYGQALEDQRIKLVYAVGVFTLDLSGFSLPVNPRTWPIILQPALQELKTTLGEADDDVMELESILTALHYLPNRTETDDERVRERQREKEVIKRRLAELDSRSALVREAIRRTVDKVNGEPGNPKSFDTLDSVLEAQAYRLSFWRVAAEEINYRRFFDINDLAAIRVEDPMVFHHVHRKVLELVGKGDVTGVRVDHADGLFDPVQYFADLQQACLDALGNPGQGAGQPRSFYVVAEKILIGDERLRPDWQISGTTGYEFLNLLNGVFVLRSSRKVFRSFFGRLGGSSQDFDNAVYAAKKLILNSSMSSELHVLARRLDRICQKQRHSRDFTLENLRFALGEVVACFPVYRTYTRMEQSEVAGEDLRHTNSAIRKAKTRNPAFSEDVFDLIGSILRLQDPEGLTAEQVKERRLFVLRFQQLTGPVMAKGVEDTAFYRHFPLASLNEVGGSPESFGISLRDFHEKNRERSAGWPFSMLASSTHDTKWGEDARARLNVLSEMPLRWLRQVRRWQTLNKEWKMTLDGAKAPDRAEEYRLYQALTACWPPGLFTQEKHDAFVQRVRQFMNKAAREAKLHTSWIQPNQEYERALDAFIVRALDPVAENAFLSEFRDFHREIAVAGMLNSLAQTLLKIASPGVPDFYQGCERWNFSFVDPDNRLPVDFREGERMIEELDRRPEEERELLLRGMTNDLDDGRAKLWLVSRALRFRRAHPELFSCGSYIPLRGTGERRHHVIAFARGYGSEIVIAAAGRFFLRILGGGDSSIAPSMWAGGALALPRGLSAPAYRDVITGRVLKPQPEQGRSVLPLGEVFSRFPAALLEQLPE